MSLVAALTYAGAQRRIILSEQGCNTPNDSLEAQKLQAACYAYAYYKVRFLDGIDSFILHRHVDHQGEGGLRLGLWTWDPNRAESAMPGQHKYSYDVFKYIDTSRSLQVTDFAKSIIGIKDWADVIPGFNPTLLDQRPIPPQVGVSVGGAPVHEHTLSDFTSGAQGWRPSDNATSVEAVTEATAPGGAFLRVHFDANLPPWSTDAKTWKGADVVSAEPFPVSKRSRLNVAVRVPAPEPGQFHPGTSFYAQIRAYGADGRSVVYGVARLAPGKWNTLSADVSGWADREQVTRIKVWVRATDDVNWTGHFDIAAVSFSDDIAHTDTFRNIDVSAAADQHSPKPGSTVTITVTNNDVKLLPGDITVRDCSGVALSPAKLRVTGLTTGQSRSFSATVTKWAPDDAVYPQLCIEYHGAVLRTVVTLPPAVQTVLEGFEQGAAGWAAGADVSSVATVGSFANGPGVPHGGGKVLEATAVPVPADQWKTVVWTPATPLDLSAPGDFTAWFDAYGGVPGATGYQAKVTLSSGAAQKSQTFTVSPNSWTQLQLDVSQWSGSSSITRVEVGFRAVGTQFVWNPKFQLDDIGYFS